MSRLAEVMTTDLKRIPCQSSVLDAARRMRQENIGSLLVERPGKLLRDQESKIIGLVSETDIIRKVVAEEGNLRETKVESIITSPMISVESSWPVEEAYEMMKQQGVRYLLVTESEHVVGLISMRDILVHLKGT
ncbi:MAG: CBS domain-containing protein [Nitrospirales bacterium]|nr:CBS domain-containing protein [Nitrospira sp.]MDR4500609.1 CBS domain-containing protein [Nitrospirales bacterium]